MDVNPSEPVASYRRYPIGKSISIKINRITMYCKRVFFGVFLNLMKNIIEYGSNNIIPSYLTIEIKDISINPIQTNFLFSLKNNAREEVARKMNNGSVSPENEFSIIRGSNMKNIAHSNERFFPKNLRDRKKTGITVTNEKNIEENLWIVMNPIAESKSKNVKIRDRKSGHPLFGNVYEFGSSPNNIVSIA